MKTKKIGLILIALTLTAVPTFAKIDGKISKDSFFDSEKTIMSEIAPSRTLRTEKYWEKNVLYFNKYKPLFMLSNKDLYDLMPEEPVSVVQRISTPSVYNISLKSASIKTVSFNPVQQKSVAEKKPTPAVQTVKKAEPKYSTIYEEAKNPQIDSEKKIEAAVLLKDSKIKSNYALAIDLLDDVTRKEPYNAYAFYLKGELYSFEGNSQLAIKNYVEALKLNPTSKQCCLGIAKVLEPTNKTLAQKYYDKAK